MPTGAFARVPVTITTDGGPQSAFFNEKTTTITVMIRLPGLRPRGDQLRLFAAGLGIVTCILMWTFIGIKYNIPVSSRGNLGIFVWAVLACLFVAYMLLRFIVGRTRADDLTSKVLEMLVRIYQRVSGTA